jgi:hypothetical protein
MSPKRYWERTTRFSEPPFWGLVQAPRSTSVFGGDLILGDVDDDRVTNLGFFSGPIHLTFDDPGIFVLGGVVPEPSTWAMMLLGYAGLGLVGYRQTRGAKPQAA